MITRLVAGLITGQPEVVFPLSIIERAALSILEWFPVGFSRRLAAWRVARSAVKPARLHTLRTSELVSGRLGDYAGLDHQFEVILIGSALGGATAHLAAVLGAPFLPQPYILGVAGGTRDDRLASYTDQIIPLAVSILERNPELAAIAHFDPVHDGWLTPYQAHLRLKLIDLPDEYRMFIKSHLKPGGTILYLDCSARWLQYDLGDRLTLQIGGWGDIPAEEYLTGSERIDRFLAGRGSYHRGGWWLADREPLPAFESEWGSMTGLDRGLRKYADREGYEFQTLRFEHPHDFSTLAFHAHVQLHRQQGTTPYGVLIEMFTQYAPGTVLRRGLLPLWLVFNTEDSRAYLESARAWFPGGLPVYFSALVTLSRTPDMVAWSGWESALSGLDWMSVGARPRRYPEDLRALTTWIADLEDMLPPARAGDLPTLNVAALLELAGHIPLVADLIP